MPGEEVRLGPFVGGLNTYSDPTAIGNTSLAEVVNFEMDEDGALTNRPPFEYLPIPIPSGTSPGFYGKILGYYSSPGGGTRLIATNTVSGTYQFDGTSWTYITVAMNACVQYRDELWFVGNSVSGKWSPASGWAADANMPKGSAIISHKDRLWIVSGKKSTSNGSRLYVSTIVNAAVNWPTSPMFVNIGAGDGQNIVDLTVYNSDIVVFKESSTYRFSYMADPALGSLSKISSTIGISDTQCYAEHENSIYLLYGNKVYMFINYNFEELNSTVPLRATNMAPNLFQRASLSIWADRLIIQFYDTTYVFRLKTRTWSIWKCTSHALLNYMGRFWPDPAAPAGNPAAYVVSPEEAKGGLFRIQELPSTVREAIDCHIVTKNYDYDSSSRFKRLFWWGADVIANVSLTLTVLPISYGRQATWGEIKNKKWSELYTWIQPLTPTLEVSEVIPVGGLSYSRKFVRAIKSLRFRQVAFKVQGRTYGDVTTAPLKIFSLSTVISDKQSVSKKIS